MIHMNIEKPQSQMESLARAFKWVLIGMLFTDLLVGALGFLIPFYVSNETTNMEIYSKRYDELLATLTVIQFVFSSIFLLGIWHFSKLLQTTIAKVVLGFLSISLFLAKLASFYTTGWITEILLSSAEVFEIAVVFICTFVVWRFAVKTQID
jgi:hypothetical protein